jgi:lysophospholipase L1-like esterase
VRLLRLLVPGAALLLTAACAGASAGGSVKTLQVVGLGDSVMAGTHCDCAGLAEEYAAGLGKRTGERVSVKNLGTDGAVTGDLLEDLRGDASTRAAIADADVVLVTIGANDLLPQLDQWRSGGCDQACFAGPAAQMGRNLAGVLAVLNSIRNPRHGAVLVTDYWNVFTDGDVARNSGGQAQVDWSTDVTAAANQQICTAARSAGDTCVDLVGVFKPGGADPTPLLADDGDHPNAAGVRAIVQALLAATPPQP